MLLLVFAIMGLFHSVIVVVVFCFYEIFSGGGWLVGWLNIIEEMYPWNVKNLCIFSSNTHDDSIFNAAVGGDFVIRLSVGCYICIHRIFFAWTKKLRTNFFSIFFLLLQFATIFNIFCLMNTAIDWLLLLLLWYS